MIILTRSEKTKDSSDGKRVKRLTSNGDKKIYTGYLVQNTQMDLGFSKRS